MMSHVNLYSTKHCAVALPLTLTAPSSSALAISFTLSVLSLSLIYLIVVSIWMLVVGIVVFSSLLCCCLNMVRSSHIASNSASELPMVPCLCSCLGIRSIGCLLMVSTSFFIAPRLQCVPIFNIEATGEAIIHVFEFLHNVGVGAWLPCVAYWPVPGTNGGMPPPGLYCGVRPPWHPAPPRPPPGLLPP